MAGNAVIGALRVSLGLDSAQFEAGLKKAQSGLNKFGKFAAVGLAAAATAAVAAGTAIAIAGKKAIDTADNMSKAAQKVGVATEALSRLNYAAGYSDVSLEQLSGGLQKLSKNLADVASGKGGAASTALAALGIKATDATGRLRSADDVFIDVADRFGRMEDSSTKTALAIQLFGKSGADLIPLLNSGKDGLKAMANESDRLGLTISTKTGRAAEQFNDTLTKVGRILEGVALRVAEGALPALQDLADLLASPQFASAAQELATNLVNALGVITRAAVATLNSIKALKDGLNPDQATIEQRYRAANGIADPNQSTNIEDRTVPGYSRGQDLAYLGSSPAFGDLSSFKMGGGGGGLATPTFTNETVAKAADQAKKAYDALILTGRQFIDEQNTEAAALGMTHEAASRLRHEQELLADAASKNITLTPQQTEALKGLAAEMAATEERTRQLTEIYDTGKSAFGTFFSDLKSGLESGTSLWGSFAEAGGKALQSIADKVLEMAANGIFDMLFNSFLGGGGFSPFGGSAITPSTGLMPSFAGGGYTGMGSRAGGMDGQGGFLAMMHPNETVTDHSRGQGGMNVVVNNYGNDQVSTQQRPDGGIDVIIGEVSKHMASGGFDRSLGGRYGVAPRTRRT